MAVVQCATSAISGTSGSNEFQLVEIIERFISYKVIIQSYYNKFLIILLYLYVVMPLMADMAHIEQ